jgi:hypothetical protein
MYHYPADIYTEPEPDTDTDTLANLGPGCARRAHTQSNGARGAADDPIRRPSRIVRVHRLVPHGINRTAGEWLKV